MLLTEQQAKSKWCPHARVIRWETLNQGETSVDHLIGGTNRDALGKTKNPGSCRCIAGECMAWRWRSSNDADPVVSLVVRHAGISQRLHEAFQMAADHDPDTSLAGHGMLDNLRAEAESLVETWVADLPGPEWRHADPPYVDDDGEGYVFQVIERDKRDDERRGFCGLAGRVP